MPGLAVFNYMVVVDREKCTGCRNCIEICQTEAVALDDNEMAQVDHMRCVG